MATKRNLFLLSTIVLMVASALLPCTAAADFGLGASIEFNFLQFIGTGNIDISSDAVNESQSGDLEFDADFSPALGITMNYEQPSYFVGGKLLISSIKGDGSWETQDFDDDGGFSIEMRQIGAWFGYYFTQNRLKPMILGGLSYNMCKLDPSGDVPSGDISLVGVHLGGGVKYFITRNLAIGGGGRLDYFLTVDKYSENVNFHGIDAKAEADLNWLPLYGFFLVEYHFGDGNAAAPGSLPHGEKNPSEAVKEESEE